MKASEKLGVASVVGVLGAILLVAVLVLAINPKLRCETLGGNWHRSVTGNIMQVDADGSFTGGVSPTVVREECVW